MDGGSEPLGLVSHRPNLSGFLVNIIIKLEGNVVCGYISQIAEALCMPLASLDELQSRLHLVDWRMTPPWNVWVENALTLNNTCSDWAEVMEIWTSFTDWDPVTISGLKFLEEEMENCADQDCVQSAFPVWWCWAKRLFRCFAPERRGTEDSCWADKLLCSYFFCLFFFFCKTIFAQSEWWVFASPSSLPHVILHNWMLLFQRILLDSWNHRSSCRCTVAVLADIELFLFLLPLNTCSDCTEFFHVSHAMSDKSKKKTFSLLKYMLAFNILE